MKDVRCKKAIMAPFSRLQVDCIRPFENLLRVGSEDIFVAYFLLDCHILLTFAKVFTAEEQSLLGGEEL